MGTLGGFPNPRHLPPALPPPRYARPRAMVRAELRSAARDGARRAELGGSPRWIVMETLGGFPNLPAMVRAEQSSAAPHAFA